MPGTSASSAPPRALALAPTAKGEVVSPEAFRQLPEETQAATRSDIAELEKELQEILKKVPQWDRERREQLRVLNQEVVSHAVGQFIEDLGGDYGDLPEVLDYVEQVRADLLENAEEFRTPETREPQQGMTVARSGPREPSFRRYEVNVIVDNSGREGAPVVYEDLPTHGNVIGRIEQMAQFGALTTDFTLIKPGALHAANGGYLMVDARKLFMQPIIWEEIKRALQSSEIRIHGLTEAMGFANTVTLQPQPIPLDVKVVLLGDPTIYYLLSQSDPDFPELFKVAADFDDQVSRDQGNTVRYAQMIADTARREGLRPLSSGGRRPGHRAGGPAGRRLGAPDPAPAVHRESSLRSRLLGRPGRQRRDRGAGRPARHRGPDPPGRPHPRAQPGADPAGDPAHRHRRRGGGPGERAVGAATGRVRLRQAQPHHRPGAPGAGRGAGYRAGGVEMGGPLHSKGVLILTGFLGARFARRHPLALSASLVFEQSYGGVDGDSASSTELYALLSALSGVPIRQSLAVTGSVNQRGEVQAIGGVNEKIEGFFDICAARGLTGRQGVLIPSANVKHLMLRGDVVEAAAQGKFHVYPVETVDQGIEILTGVPAGEPDPQGDFRAGTVNGLAQATLLEFALNARNFAAGGGSDPEVRS